MKSKTKALFIIGLYLATCVTAAAQRYPLPKKVNAPPLRHLSPVAIWEFGGFNSILASPQTDSLFMLRAGSLYQLSLIEPYKVKLVGANELFSGQTPEESFTQGGRTYILFNFAESRTKSDAAFYKSTPVLYEVSSKQIIPLAPYGLYHYNQGKTRLTGYVNAHSMYVHGNGMLYTLSFTPPAKPAWCWIDLATGQIEAYPDWNFIHTDAAGRIAVFGYYKGRDRVHIGIDIATGQAVDGLPTEFSSAVDGKNILKPRAVSAISMDQSQDAEGKVIGVFVGNKGLYRAEFPAESGTVEKVDVSDTFAALNVRYGDRAKNEKEDTENLWVMQLRNETPVKRVCKNIQKFAMLDGGYCLYRDRTEGKDSGSIIDTTHVYDFAKHQSWDLLDGLDDTPLSVRPSVNDVSLSFEITPGFGQSLDGRWALAEVRQTYIAKRDVEWFGESGVIPSRTILWKLLLVSSQGNRYEIRIPKDWHDTVLLNNQGALIRQIPIENNHAIIGYDLELYQFKLPGKSDR